MDKQEGNIEMFDQVNIHSEVAVYIQIENEVRFAIAAGNLNPGEQLPSVREMSERIKVNPNTIAKAYRDLEVMGLLYTRRDMGVYIKEGVQAQCREDCRKRLAERVFEVTQEAKSAGTSNKDFAELVAKCWIKDGNPYGEVPKSVLDSIKSRS